MLPDVSLCKSCSTPKFELWETNYYESNGYCGHTRYIDGSIRLKNPNIELMDQDILYHLALGSGSHDLESMFGDVRFVVMGGTPKRMEEFAYYVMKEIDYQLPAGAALMDISKISYRYSMYKVGPVLCLSHGMGIPSISILLHEIIKLLYHAKCKEPIIFRLGTCGGIGLEPGTVVITESAVDGLLRPYLELPVLGKIQRRSAILDADLVEDLKRMHESTDKYDVKSGKTMCTYDFYEGQGRLDGAFCEFSEDDKMEFLDRLLKEGILNMEMESLAFAAVCYHAGIRAAVACVTIVNRLQGDQVASSKETLNEWQQRPGEIITRFIKNELKKVQKSDVCEQPAPSIRCNKKATVVTQESHSYE